jgi:hypothetical protein
MQKRRLSQRSAIWNALWSTPIAGNIFPIVIPVIYSEVTHRSALLQSDGCSHLISFTCKRNKIMLNLYEFLFVWDCAHLMKPCVSYLSVWCSGSSGIIMFTFFTFNVINWLNYWIFIYFFQEIFSYFDLNEIWSKSRKLTQRKIN